MEILVNGTDRTTLEEYLLLYLPERRQAHRAYFRRESVIGT